MKRPVIGAIGEAAIDAVDALGRATVPEPELCTVRMRAEPNRVGLEHMAGAEELQLPDRFDHMNPIGLADRFGAGHRRPGQSERQSGGGQNMTARTIHARRDIAPIIVFVQPLFLRLQSAYWGSVLHGVMQIVVVGCPRVWLRPAVV